ncbi:MAG: carboxyl-terminal protease [Clostridiales bacterium]|jgi:hypothetical protein|nr:carboxyl-terminal protease [Clostridiales bacterium]
MRGTKKKLILTVCTIFVIATISGCNNSVDANNNAETITKTETVNEVVTTSQIEDNKTSPVIAETLKFIYSQNDGEGFELEAIKENGLFYLAASDFIDICNIINKRFKMIETLNYESLNKETLELKVIYNSKVNSYSRILGGTLGTATLVLESVEFSGENKMILLKLNDQIIKPITKGEQHYIPIDFINYVVFSGQPYLLRSDENTYDLSTFYYGEEIEENARYIDQDYSDYRIALLLLDEYLFNNYSHYQRFDIPDSIEDYSEYFIMMFQMCLSLEDYHFSILSDKADPDKLTEYGIEDIYTKSFMYYLNTFENKTQLPSEVEWLSNNCLYIPFQTFAGQGEFRKLDEVLVNDADKLSNQVNIVLDLRNNGGGELLNSYKLLKRFIEDTIVVQVSNNYRNEILGTATYTIKGINPKERNYNFTVIVNETSASASILATSALKDNFGAHIIGREPLYKQTGYVECLQLPDGTLITLSRPDYSFINKDGIRVDDSILVDQTMTDEEIDVFLESLRE